MAEKYLNEQHYDYSGGVVQATGRLVKLDNECEVIQNGELDTIGPIHKVRGYTQRGATVNSNYNILGAVNAYKPSDGTRKQIVVADGLASSDAYTYNPITDAWTKHNLSLTSGSKAEFESFLDGFFMVNFTEATRWNDLAQWYTTTNVTNAAKAKYIKQYLSRIYLAYVVSGGTTYPSRVTYSDLPSGTPMTVAWNDTVNHFDVDTEDGDVIKGLEVNANRLLIFKENSLHRYDTNTRYKVPGCPGTVSSRSIGNIQGWTLYLHSTGIWGYDGSSSRLLSRKIKDIIDGIATKSFINACCWIKGDHYYLYVGDINNPKTGLTISKCLIDYDVAKTAFTWRSLEKEPLIFCNYPDDRSGVTYNSATITYNDADTMYNALMSAEERVYFGNTDGAVYQFDTGMNYDGSSITFLIETKDYYLGYPSLYKLLQKVQVFVDSGKGVTIQFKMDDKDWKTLGRVDKTQTELIFPDASRCQRVRFRVSESSKGGRFAFEGLEIFYILEGLVE